MKTRTLAVSLVAAVAGILIALPFAYARQDNRPTRPQTPPSASAGAFQVDPVHSTLIFKIQHMGVANFYGRFNEISGTYRPEPNGNFNIQVKTESVDTGNRKRDDHLRTHEFFNANDFPTIEFKSTKIESTGQNKLRVTGDLTLHGETNPITADMTVFPAKDTGWGVKGGFEAKFSINRKDFGMDSQAAEAVGETVDIIVSVEGAAAK